MGAESVRTCPNRAGPLQVGTAWGIGSLGFSPRVFTVHPNALSSGHDRVAGIEPCAMNLIHVLLKIFCRFGKDVIGAQGPKL